MKYTDDRGEPIVSSYIKTGVLAFFGIMVLFNLPILFVPVGYRGVQLRLGNTTGNIFQQGMNFRVPFIEGTRNIEVRTQKETIKATAASKDLQSVEAEVALNFSLEPNKLVSLYQTVGDEYKERIIAPVLQEAVKAVTARYTAEELITKRGQVSADIKAMLSEKLSPRGIMSEDFNIVNFTFSQSFDDAIERKVTAEQNALASKNKLEQIKYEAEQRIAQAKGESEAIRIQSEAINSQGGANYVQMKAIEKWNGVLPAQMIPNATVPFIDLK
jgi:regulator of protease activity HflC (stomatin/prohibitin superfamily)